MLAHNRRSKVVLFLILPFACLIWFVGWAFIHWVPEKKISRYSKEAIAGQSLLHVS